MTRKGRIFLIAAGAGLALLAGLVYMLFRTEEDARRRRAAATAETTAVQHLKDIAACQQGYSTVYGEYTTFPQLAASCYLLNEKFAAETPVVGGYAYRMEVRPRSGDRPGFFSVSADPQPAPGEYTGELHFYTDSDVGNIRQRADRPATASDRPRE